MYRTFDDYDDAHAYAVTMVRQLRRDMGIEALRGADGTGYYAVSSIQHCFGSDAGKERICASEYRL